MDFNRYRQNSYSREELIQIIGHALGNMTDGELEAIYYDLLTKDYIR